MKQLKVHHKSLKIIGKILLYCSIVAAIVGISFLSYRGIKLIDSTTAILSDYANALPQPKIEEKSGEPSNLYDRNGNFLYEIHGDIRRRNINLQDVPLNVQQAFVAAEDHEFYTHKGVSFRNIIASISENLGSQEVERGASTIPMQLAKNLSLTSEKTMERKVKEIAIAILITNKYSKNQILERYLNEVPVGGNLVGIAAASETYFKKEVKALSLLEGATIAALINAPSLLSPYNSSQTLRQRTEIIIDQMVELSFISKTEADEAKRQELAFSPDIETIKYPYFVMYTRTALEKKYGQEKIEYGGLKITTTIDPRLQDLAEKVLTEKTKDYSKKWLADDAALVSLDPKTGQILAMQGGRNFWNSQVNVVTSKRQPGSSFKPFIYLTAFENGYSDNTMVLDAIKDFGGGYKPLDYGGGASGKWWPIRLALIQSLNIPAVATLQRIGVEPTITRLNELGFFDLNPNAGYGLPLALGAAEVTPLEMAVGASVMANGGNQVEPLAWLKIEKNDGNLLTTNEWISANKRIADQNAVALVNSILSDYQSKKGFYNYTWYKNYTLEDRPAAAKTGTSSGPKDCWLMGYTPNLVTIVWVGNNDSRLMKNDADGINVAAPIWDAYMEEAVKLFPKEDFAKPAAVTLDNYHKTIQ